MDWLDRQQDREERLRNVHRTPEPARHNEPPKTNHEITIIGCVRGVDGWYRAGFDEQTKTVVPMEFLGKD